MEQIQGSIYFSYAWNDKDGEREQIVNQLYDSLRDEGFDIKRDKMDLRYGDLISGFMTKIGKGKLIIVAISNKYLRSPYCMWELYEIYRNSKLEKKNFVSRILPLRVENIDLSLPAVTKIYFEHWGSVLKEWIDFSNTHAENFGRPQHETFLKVKAINGSLGDLLGYFSDINSKSKELLSENDFVEVKSLISRRLGTKTATKISIQGSNGVNLNKVDVRWHMVQNKSTHESINNENDLVINPHSKIVPKILSGHGGSDYDDPDHQNLGYVLLRRAKRLFPEATKYLNVNTDFTELTLKHPNIVRRLMPTYAELDSLDEFEKRLLSKWLIQYVGQWNPTIRFVVDNTFTSMQFQVIGLEYNVDEIMKMKAAINTPQVQEFSFDIPYATGVHRFDFSSQGLEVTVLPNSVVHFDITFSPAEDAPLSPRWRGRVSLITNVGKKEVGRLYITTLNQRRGGLAVKSALHES
jgi:hypothetical protein